MKTIITTLNAKFIHTALSLRLLYIASYKEHDVEFIEYTIKDQLDHIVSSLLEKNPSIIAFSCYIWNVEETKAVISKIKSTNPEIKIIMGGPEVTYEPEFFLNNFEIDYIMSGEGEVTFPMLIDQIEKKQLVNVPGVSYKGHISKEITQTPLEFIERLDSPYNLPQDKKNMAHRLLYFETSRGCPFLCQYCLSSLEKGMRFYSKEYLKKQLDIICHSDAKIIKVLDRSFNAKMEHALFVLDYIFKNYTPGQQYQFEINADVFPMKIVEYINENAPKNLLRFEVGIQSTHEPTNRAVKRMQNFEKLSAVVKALMEGGKCDLHLDLIAGLPYESYDRFKQSFDEVFKFRAKELQLGFLKMLRGTSLRNDAENYGYTYQETAPYEMIHNDWMSEIEISQVHLAEDMLEKYWNSGRFSRSMNQIMDDNDSAFDFFYNLGVYYQKNNYPFHGFQLDLLYKILNEYTHYNYQDLLIIDYLSISKTKPKRFYEPTISTELRHQVIEALGNLGHNKDRLYRYSRIEKLKDGYLVAIYQNMQCEIDIYPLTIIT